ncbi:uncharacterized protein LOC114743533 [Neltuma alba]|uniref:uncharacterized protein LOC114743533 n=1 Tax=Neltuma alba TaxID=207710 RepID=UPI0010A502B5|nr:uncharacterized protein LOC114743533 [Prosopis alba]
MCAAKSIIATQILFLPLFSFRFSCENIKIKYLNTMKLSGLLAASVAAASATVVSVSATAKVTYQDGLVGKGLKESSSVRSCSGNKFAPRFDGLRFIETLVTAHR